MTLEQSQRIVLDVANCKTGGYYRVVFTGPRSVEIATDFYSRHASTHAMYLPLEEMALGWVTEAEGRFHNEVLDPPCEHGMSSSLCMGPMHYPSAEQEREWGW
jgi:hypothetical protein